MHVHCLVTPSPRYSEPPTVTQANAEARVESEKIDRMAGGEPHPAHSSSLSSSRERGTLVNIP